MLVYSANPVHTMPLSETLGTRYDSHVRKYEQLYHTLNSTLRFGAVPSKSDICYSKYLSNHPAQEKLILERALYQFFSSLATEFRQARFCLLVTSFHDTILSQELQMQVVGPND